MQPTYADVVTVPRRNRVWQHLEQLRQTGTIEAYVRMFYAIVGGGSTGIPADTITEVFLLGLRSPHLRAALMQLPLHSMTLWELTSHACRLALTLDC